MNSRRPLCEDQHYLLLTLSHHPRQANQLLYILFLRERKSPTFASYNSCASLFSAINFKYYRRLKKTPFKDTQSLDSELIETDWFFTYCLQLPFYWSLKHGIQLWCDIYFPICLKLFYLEPTSFSEEEGFPNWGGRAGWRPALRLHRKQFDSFCVSSNNWCIDHTDSQARISKWCQCKN